MVAEKETLSLNKCPDKMPKRTKLLAQQPLPVHQPHSLVSEGFTVKAMMKNSVVSDLPELNALAPYQGTRDLQRLASPRMDSEPMSWVVFAKNGNYLASSRRSPTVCGGQARLLESWANDILCPLISTFLITHRF